MSPAKRILVIEDNRENLELMTYLLRAAGYSLSIAEDGTSGLEAARRERPDLVLCDIRMPGMSGYDVAREFKSDNALKFIPLIAVTASAMVGDREKILSSGFELYFSKPIRPEVFVADIENFLAAPRPQ